jgi:RNA ligase
MTFVDTFLDHGKLLAARDTGLVTERRHPADDSLLIYNYTNRCVYEDAWTPETLAARGLILNAVGSVFARPLKKFFNLSQHLPDSSLYPRLPIGSPFEAFEKLDGSLTISYPLHGQCHMATRGSFDSPQARAATAWWQEHGCPIPDGQTWLFEWIAPENRIVVDYGQRWELVLLAVIDIETGKDLPLPDWGGACARRYDADSIEDLLAMAPTGSNFEGYVIRFPSTGQRVKVKLPEYLRLHKLLTGCTSRSIWELLSAGGDISEVLDRVPDEFYAWVAARTAELRQRYAEIEAACRAIMSSPRLEGCDRKGAAEFFAPFEHRAVLFRMLDNKDYAHLIWKAIRPEHAKPFAMDEP